MSDFQTADGEQRSARRSPVGCCGGCGLTLAAFFLFLICMPTIQGAVRRWVAEDSDHIIAALDRYCSDHESPPPNLQVLVPEYLENSPSFKGCHYNYIPYPETGGWVILVLDRFESMNVDVNYLLCTSSSPRTEEGEYGPWSYVVVD